MPSRPRVPIWARIVGTVAFAAALGMLVWAGFDLVHGRGVSEVVIDIFIAIVFGGIAATLFGLWRGGRGPVVAADGPAQHDSAQKDSAQHDPGAGPDDQADAPPRR